MARPLRIEYDGAVYHVASRGDGRKAIFKDDGDREVFLDVLQKVNKRYNWLCHAYCHITHYLELDDEDVPDICNCRPSNP